MLLQFGENEPLIATDEGTVVNLESYLSRINEINQDSKMLMKLLNDLFYKDSFFCLDELLQALNLPQKVIAIIKEVDDILVRFAILYAFASLSGLIEIEKLKEIFGEDIEAIMYMSGIFSSVNSVRAIRKFVRKFANKNIQISDQ